VEKYHARIEGRVQGVFFRDFTRREALRLGLAGWVRNMPDRSVEAVFQGESAAVNKMLQWLSCGSPHSNVTKVETKKLKDIEPLTDFIIRY